MGIAEAMVRRAWAEELLRQRDHVEFAVAAARADYEAASRDLAAAQRDGDPGKISLARATLERAVEDVRTSTLARNQVRWRSRVELSLLARAAKKHTVSALVRRVGHDRVVIAAAPHETSGPRARRLRSDAMVARRERRVPRWLGRLLVRRAAGLAQP